MNKLAIFIITILSLFSCSEKKPVATIDKIYLIEYNFHAPEPPETDWLFYVNGITEADHFYNMKVTRRMPYRGDYFSSVSVPGDSIRYKLSKIFDKYQQDTAFVSSQNTYGGNYYFLWIEKSDMDRIFIDLHKLEELPEDIRYVYENLYGSFQDKRTGYKITDTDSLQQYCTRFEKCLPGKHISRPPAIILDKNLTGIPTADEETSSSDDSEV